MIRIRNLCLATLLLLAGLAQAKEVRDTLFSGSGDRVIVTYSIVQNGGQLSVRFQGVQKKLGQKHQEKYKKLNEVAVVMFDRSGNYSDIKFDGMTAEAFMVPSNLSYNKSSDGYFLLQDEPSISFGVTSGKAQLTIPLYLAHYEGKRHYKVFAKCGDLKLTSSGESRRAVGIAVGQGEMEVETVTSSTEEEILTDEGLSPVDEAAIRISSLNSMLERATKFPLSEDLTHEAQMLRELRFKITDPEVSAQISQVLENYENKKQELESQADASQQQAAAAQAAAAQAQQARADSIAAAQAEQSSKDKKDMMWLIGGIGVLSLLFMGGKQLYQTIKNNKMQKQMMDSIKQAQNAAMRSASNAVDSAIDGANPMTGVNVPGVNQVTQKLKNEAKRTMSKEAEAARQRLMQMKGGKTTNGTPAQPVATAAQGTKPTSTQPAKSASAQPTKPRKPSMNDVIPSKYKRWRKPGQENNNNKVSI